MDPDKTLLRKRILGEIHRTLTSLADETRPVGPGWGIRTYSLPLVWSLNQLRITQPAASDEVIDLSEELQADLPYRHVVVEDDATGRHLEDVLGGGGWKVDREVLMALTDDPDRVVGTGAVVELRQEQMLELMRRWDVEEHEGISEEALDQLQEYKLREARIWHEWSFGILDAGGDPLALTKLRSKGATAWVEDVYTVPEARGRGHARTLVSHATELARSTTYDLAFITADDNDWPKQLYGSVGFRPVGTTRTFHRRRSSP